MEMGPEDDNVLSCRDPIIAVRVHVNRVFEFNLLTSTPRLEEV